eukprot:3471442-Karenia_brevis.AAC.1
MHRPNGSSWILGIWCEPCVPPEGELRPTSVGRELSTLRFAWRTRAFGNRSQKLRKLWLMPLSRS